MEPEAHSPFLLLKKYFPSIPEDRIAHYLNKFNGDARKAEEELKYQLHKARKAEKHAKGEWRGKHNCHARHGRTPEKLDVDIARLVDKYQNLYPEAPEDEIQKMAEKSCQKLKYMGKRGKNNQGRGPSSNSSRECEKSGSQKHRKNNVERPANFQELIKTMRNNFPDIEERKLVRILERHEFDVERATRGTKRRFEHKKPAWGHVEDELLLKEIPSTVSKVIVDGNNLVFINEIIRGITIQHGMTRGTQALSKLISAFNLVENRNILVVYDEIHGKLKFENIRTDTARPKFRSSDDYLVTLCEEMTIEEKATAMFVTSDVGLKERLYKAGSKNIMKSLSFMKLCESKVPNVLEITEKK